MYRPLILLGLVVFWTLPLRGADQADRPEPPAPTPLDRLKADPNDTQSIIALVNGGVAAAVKLSEAKPDEAIKKLAELKTELDALMPDKAEAKQILAQAKTVTARLERRLESAKKLAELVGKPAAPLAEDIKTWLNGEPLKDGDLKGKVVLLDFWAVWCGPCIATFPHLKEWNEKYKDKGLLIVGLTNYEGRFEWDDSAARIKRATSKLTVEDENEMLRKFAEHHSLHHRFAMQKEGSSLADYYAVSGIPHVVLIDQEGKVRLVRVGSGPENAKAIGDMIEKLLATSAAEK